MKQFPITHDSEAFEAFARHNNINLNEPGAVLSKLRFMAVVKCEAIGSKQAWILTDENGNKWLQSYNTIVSVKWADTGAVEHFGKWSVTTSRHQTYFARVA